MKGKESVEIWCDGSSSNNKTRCGGWAYYMKYKDKEKSDYGGVEDTTNNQMEMLALIKALEQIRTKHIPLKIHLDSAYVLNCLEQKWYVKWERKGWKTSSGGVVKNIDLWKVLISLVNRQENIEFIKVKGHSGVELNELVDDLAVKGRNEIEMRLNA